jgi:hypothetical protein
LEIEKAVKYQMIEEMNQRDEYDYMKNISSQDDEEYNL